MALHLCLLILTDWLGGKTTEPSRNHEGRGGICSEEAADSRPDQRL